GIAAGHHVIAHFEAIGREDVALLAVDVVEEGDARGAIGIVLDRRDHRRYPYLFSTKVDEAIALFVAATAEAAGHPTVMCAPAGRGLMLEQTPLRLGFGDLGEVADGVVAAGRARWLERLETHVLTLGFEELDLVALLEGDDRFFPVRKLGVAAP